MLSTQQTKCFNHSVKTRQQISHVPLLPHRQPCPLQLHHQRPAVVTRVLSEPLKVTPVATPPVKETVTHTRIEDSRPQHQTSTSSASAADARRMFDEHHVSQWSLGLVLYMPVGLMVAMFRSVLWVLGIVMDAPWFRNKSVVSAYLGLLGFKAKWNNLHLVPEGYHVMVSNHTTSGDLMSLFQMPSRYTHLITTAMPAKVTATKNLPLDLRPATPDMYDKLAAEAGPSSQPVHLFPEGGLTNGKGMLQFSRGFMKFAQGQKVVPVALRAKTPFGIRSHTLNSSFLANLFWISFCPWFEIEATVLPPMEQQEGEGKGAFVQRVQQVIANELGVPISEMTISQKRKMMQQALKGKK